MSRTQWAIRNEDGDRERRPYTVTLLKTRNVIHLIKFLPECVANSREQRISPEYEEQCFNAIVSSWVAVDVIKEGHKSLA